MYPCSHAPSSWRLEEAWALKSHERLIVSTHVHVHGCMCSKHVHVYTCVDTCMEMFGCLNRKKFNYMYMYMYLSMYIVRAG